MRYQQQCCSEHLARASRRCARGERDVRHRTPWEGFGGFAYIAGLTRGFGVHQGATPSYLRMSANSLARQQEGGGACAPAHCQRDRNHRQSLRALVLLGAGDHTALEPLAAMLTREGMAIAAAMGERACACAWHLRCSPTSSCWIRA